MKYVEAMARSLCTTFNTGQPIDLESAEEWCREWLSEELLTADLAEGSLGNVEGMTIHLDDPTDLTDGQEASELTVEFTLDPGLKEGLQFGKECDSLEYQTSEPQPHICGDPNDCCDGLCMDGASASESIDPTVALRAPTPKGTPSELGERVLLNCKNSDDVASFADNYHDQTLLELLGSEELFTTELYRLEKHRGSVVEPDTLRKVLLLTLFWRNCQYLDIDDSKFKTLVFRQQTWKQK